jgi:ATP-dependent helicase HepA
MENCYPEQRWISHTEPELGLGIILDVTAHRVTVSFLAVQEQRVYARLNAPLTRVQYICGDTIKTIDQQSLSVQEVQTIEHIQYYHCLNKQQEKITVKETSLSHYLQFNKPQDRLFTYQIDTGKWFELRYETLRHSNRLQQLKARGLIAGRTSLMPHQLYIAHEVANRGCFRIILADEVGLGKTIEAGLILNHRLLTGRSGRTLVIVPEPLLHQWLVEMLRRFNLKFSLFDEERCLEFPDENPFLSTQLILCSPKLFTDNPQRQQQVLATDWHTLVVDEAHHLHWSETESSSEYQLVDKLSQKTTNVLLLTATPEQLGIQSHFAQLRLLDPDRFFSLNEFIHEKEFFQPVADAATHLIAGQSLPEDLIQQLQPLLKQDQTEILVAQANNHDADAQKELLNILLDHHGTSRILFRNSRQTIGGFPLRQCHAYPLNDLPEQQPYWDDLSQEKNPYFIWLVDKLKTLASEKVLLICHQAKTAIALGDQLKNRKGIKLAIFHEQLSIIERDRAAAYFSDPDSHANILLCSEIGSEGRNFQFAKHLILLDLPENPDLLQQRIGRLDRIGQKHIIQIHTPYLIHSSQHVLYSWYNDGLNAFEQNCSTGAQIFQRLHNTLKDLMDNFSTEGLDRVITETKQLRKTIEMESQHGRDQLLEINSCREEQAHAIVAEIVDLEKQNNLWPYMETLFDCYGVNTEFHSPDCYIITPGNHLRIAHFPELPEDGLTVTTQRAQALIREDRQFLSWEHPMTIAAMDLVLSSDTGNATISIVKHPALAPNQFLIETLFIIECSAPKELQISRFLPPTPIRILIDQKQNNISKRISHNSLIEVHPPVEPRKFNSFVTSQRKLIEHLIQYAHAEAEQQLHTHCQEAHQAMEKNLNHEINRLVRLQRSNPSIKPEEISYLTESKTFSGQCIASSELKLDAIRLLITQ